MEKIKIIKTWIFILMYSSGWVGGFKSHFKECLRASNLKAKEIRYRNRQNEKYRKDRKKNIEPVIEKRQL